MGGSISIQLAGEERLDDLRPLWESLSEHHVGVAPELRSLGPVRAPADSWAVRRAYYLSLFAAPGSFVLIAADGAPVGYALIAVRGSEESWETGPVAELETLAVLPSHRGRGIGTALVDAAMAELTARGIGHWTVAVIAANADAVRFYERLGLTPFTNSYIGRVPPRQGAGA